MRTARRNTILLVALMIASFTLSGCAGRKWYWPFSKTKTTTPTASLTETGTPAGYPEGTAYSEPAPPEVPGVATQTEGQAPTAGTLPAGTLATDAAGGIPASNEIRKAADMTSELKMINFDYDRSELSPVAQGTLDSNIEWLLQHPGIQVQIEGHCDERGTVEYNLTLGQRRADSVREYLVGKGIDANSLHTISYGKERPLAFGDTPEEHAQNRRAQFLIFTD